MATLSWWITGGWNGDQTSPLRAWAQQIPNRFPRHPKPALAIEPRLFPFALWESGRKPRSHVDRIVARDPETTLVLHTTFLAPLAAGLCQSGRRVVVDVYDAIFRGHLDEAEGASLGMRAVRRAYASHVQRRECGALMPVPSLLAAGWDDARLLKGLGLKRITWAPTGLEAQLSVMPDTDRIHVGLLGNFNHTVTARAALELMASPLGSDPSVQIILAGIGSESYEGHDRVRSLGRIKTTQEFYDQVHATVVPVANGTGRSASWARRHSLVRLSSQHGLVLWDIRQSFRTHSL